MRLRLALACALTFAAIPPLWPRTRSVFAPTRSRLSSRRSPGSSRTPGASLSCPTATMLVTEEPGRLRIVDAHGKLSEPLEGVPAHLGPRPGRASGRGARSEFRQNRLVYLSFAEDRGDGRNGTSVARGRLSQDGTALEDAQVIFRQEPTHARHQPLRLAPRLRPRRQPLRNAGRPLRPAQSGAEPRQPSRQGRPHQADGAGRTGQSVRRTARMPSPRSGRSAIATCRRPRFNPATGELWTVEHGARGGDEVNIPRRARITAGR